MIHGDKVHVCTVQSDVYNLVNFTWRKTLRKTLLLLLAYHTIFDFPNFLTKNVGKKFFRHVRVRKMMCTAVPGCQVTDTV